MENSEQVARDLFSKYGITVGKLEPSGIESSRILSEGEECHAVFFEDGYVHFHVGYGGWRDHLPKDAPRIRVRYMTHRGREISSAEWFSC